MVFQRFSDLAAVKWEYNNSTMFSRPVVISMIVAIGLIIFSEVFLLWIAKKSKAIQGDLSNPWKKHSIWKKKKGQVVCKACGADNPPENNFCGSCGKPL
jgi:ribosomal protein L40E